MKKQSILKLKTFDGHKNFPIFPMYHKTNKSYKWISTFWLKWNLLYNDFQLKDITKLLTNIKSSFSTSTRWCMNKFWDWKWKFLESKNKKFHQVSPPFLIVLLKIWILKHVNGPTRRLSWTWLPKKTYKLPSIGLVRKVALKRKV